MLNTSFWKDKKILVTGGAGFLGAYLINQLQNAGASNVKVPIYPKVDLTREKDCKKVVKGIDIVFHLAAKVGGIGLNQKIPAELYRDNLLMGTQMMHEAWLAGVKKYITLATICSYPKHTPTPFKEEFLWQGYPEETNAPYGIAKLVQIVQSQAYRQQYNFNSIVLIPTNLYGPNDNFDKNNSHVIPALIEKIFLAKKNKKEDITIWGSGQATRSFVYIEDAARAIVLAAEKYNQSEPLNIGTQEEISILDLTKLIMEIIGFKGKIILDKSKPDGQPRRSIDGSRAQSKLGFVPKIELKVGLKKTIEWYIKNKT